MNLVRIALRSTCTLTLAAVLSTGCGKGADQPAGIAVSPAAQAEADQKWGTCVTCHGEKGDGNGIAGAALTPKPRDFNASAWQKATDDAAITKIILEGGMAVGKSALMPANVDLKDKPEVVAALVKKVRSFAK